jgi:hypothetical protein
MFVKISNPDIYFYKPKEWKQRANQSKYIKQKENQVQMEGIRPKLH